MTRPTEARRRCWFLASSLLGVGAMAHLLWRSAGGTDRVAQAAAIVAVAALLAGVAVELWRGPRER